MVNNYKAKAIQSFAIKQARELECSGSECMVFSAVDGAPIRPLSSSLGYGPLRLDGDLWQNNLFAFSRSLLVSGTLFS